MIEIILWIIFGGVVGWVASVIMNTNSQQGIVLNVVVGVIGAVLGGWFMGAVGGSSATGFSVYSFLVALAGAVAFIGIIKIFRRA